MTVICTDLVGGGVYIVCRWQVQMVLVSPHRKEVWVSFLLAEAITVATWLAYIPDLYFT